MNGADVLRIVDLMHREKNIPKEIIFGSIEAAVQLATEKHYGEEEGVVVTINRLVWRRLYRLAATRYTMDV